MTRLVFANPIGGLGGAELFLLEILSQVRALCPDWDLHLIAGADGPLLDRATELKVTVHKDFLPRRLAGLGDSAVHAPGQTEWQRLWRLGIRAAGGLGDGIQYVRRLQRRLQELQPDLIHSNGLKMHGLTDLSCPSDCRLVWFLHDYLGSRALMRRALPWVSRRVSRLVANSQSVADDASKVLPRLPIDVVHCGIDLGRFSPAVGQPEQLDALASLAVTRSNTIRIGLVATYARWKGHDTFLKAAAAVHAQFPEVRFYVIGGPIYASAGSQYSQDELQGLIHELGLDGVAGLVPFLSETPWAYRSLDVFVHASQQPEPFGRTILEAMACGKPVIAAEAGGAAEIFVPEVSGIGIQPGSVEDLTKALCRIVADGTLRERLSREARLRAGQFSEASMGSKLTTIYRQLLDKTVTPAETAVPHV
ncbi:glycosyltransferase [bacterium]|nr:glycosyltransferase [bacterium]